MITLIHSAADKPLADRISADLQASGFTVTDSIQPEREHIVVGVLSPDAVSDAAFIRAVDAANDNGQTMIVVKARPVEIPKNLDHLLQIDFSNDYPITLLKAEIATLKSANAPYAVRMNTAKVRASNRRALIGIGLLVVTMFVVASVMIILFDIESPAEEYAAVDTQVALTRDFLIEPTMQYLATILPRSTEAADAFAATVDAVPTRLQPFVAWTATAIHEQLGQFEITPAASATPDAG